MQIYELNKKNISYIARIAKLHKQAFPNFFLTQLGDGFLKTLYRGYLEDIKSGIIVAENEQGRLAGFIAYSEDYSGFYKRLIKKYLFTFAFCSIKAFVRHPSIAKRLLRAFKKSEEVVKSDKYVEIASICVNPLIKGKGIGSALIDYMKENINFEEYAYICLETDAENNKDVNSFYLKNGFKCVKTYYTAEGRKMNEYHY